MKPTAKIIAISAFLAFCSTSLADLGDPNLLEAQLLALEVSGQLRPPADLTELILNDLAAIRATFPDVADITYRMPFVPDEMLVGLTEQAVIQFQQGQYHALDELNALYGVVEIDLLLFGAIKLKFDKIYNIELLSEIYEQAYPEGLTYAQPNHMYGDGSTISADPPFYTFTRAWGDGYPFGSVGRESYLFKVENGQVTALGRDEYYVDAIYGDDDNNGLSPNTAFATIQKAIDTAYDSDYAGDVVTVAPGIYTGPGNRDIDFKGRTTTVRSTDPNDPNIVASTIIDCNGTQVEPNRGFYFRTSGYGSKCVSSVVAGLTIRNGYANNGGGIYCFNSSPKIKNCIIIGNFAAYGGGIYCDYKSSPMITNCTITGNSAEYGGGISCSDNNPTITSCTITGNSATYGGGLFKCDGLITNCTISDNSAGTGGGLYACDGPIKNCIITGNLAGAGGGLYACDGPIKNCIITANSSVSSGGGLADCIGPTTNCVITGNSATGSRSRGGGLFHCRGPITNCTITGNSAGRYGGGLADCGGPITNCIIWGNWPDQTEGTPIPIITYSNVQGGWVGEGNIDTDPCFVEPGYWVDVNDPNIIVEPNEPNSIWLDGDYRLLFDSPCIDTGDPNYVPEPNETDLDGLPRVIGGRIDMGAYEFNHQPVAVAGPNQVVYADHTGLAAVTLDGSASYDDDGQDLTYKWTWTIDGNTFTSKGTDGIVNLLDFAAFAKQWPQSENPFADLSILTKAWLSTPASPNWNRLCDIAPAGAVLTIELPVGEHIIELIVDDGIDESEPDYCTITVIGPIRGKLMITPCVLETKSHDRWILATLYLPPVADEQVNTEEPLRLYPSGIEAKYQRFSRYGRPGHSYTIALAFFDKQQVIDALGTGQVEVSVVGEFLTGRFFFGSDTIRIIAPPPHPKPPFFWR